MRAINQTSHVIFPSAQSLTNLKDQQAGQRWLRARAAEMERALSPCTPSPNSTCAEAQMRPQSSLFYTPSSCWPVNRARQLFLAPRQGLGFRIVATITTAQGAAAALTAFFGKKVH